MRPPKFSEVRDRLNDAHAELLSFVPTAVGDHLTVAKKEILAAVQAVIGEEITWTDKRWENAKAKKAERRSAAPIARDKKSAPEAQ